MNIETRSHPNAFPSSLHLKKSLVVNTIADGAKAAGAEVYRKYFIRIYSYKFIRSTRSVLAVEMTRLLSKLYNYVSLLDDFRRNVTNDIQVLLMKG